MNSSRTYIKINLDNIINNYKALRNISNGTEFMAVVKADSYGCGAEMVAKTLEEQGCKYFAVATVDEALELRKAGIKGNILVLGYVDIESHKQCLLENIDITISDFINAEKLSKLALNLDINANIHIKVDTGMSRYGFNYEKASCYIEKISMLNNITIRGIYSHFAVADEPNNEFTKVQFQRFMSVIERLKNNNINIPIKHIANSGATLMNRDMHLDMVRCGIALYGYYPSQEVPNDIGIKEVMSLYTKITRIENVKNGNSISYGCSYTLDSDRKIATIAIGYADGYSRALSNRGVVFIKGHKCKIVGRICMDSCMVDVTDCETINIGDEVEIFGDNISIEDYANSIGTINYEVMCMASKRIPILYFKNGIKTDSKNCLL